MLCIYVEYVCELFHCKEWNSISPLLHCKELYLHNSNIHTIEMYNLSTLLCFINITILNEIFEPHLYVILSNLIPCKFSTICMVLWQPKKCYQNLINVLLKMFIYHGIGWVDHNASICIINNCQMFFLNKDFVIYNPCTYVIINFLLRTMGDLVYQFVLNHNT